MDQSVSGARGTMKIGGSTFEWGSRTYVMGVVNATPDSFSGDGVGSNVEAALAQARSFEQWGADLIDVGGESTRPPSIYAGSEPVPADRELERVLPIIRAITEETDVPVSIDTYKAEVARQAVAAGASMINDVWALQRDPEMARTAAELRVPVVLMHNQDHTNYDDVVPDVISRLSWLADRAVEAGVQRDRIVLDPGMGFGKTAQHNLEILRRLGEFRSTGLPLLVGMSRKSTIGYVLDLPVEERVEGTAATVALSIAGRRGHRAGARRSRDGEGGPHERRGSTRLERRLMQAEVYLALGSNLGDRRANILRAVDLLGEVSSGLRLSPLYETEPTGFASQPSFLNAACGLWTSLDPFELLREMRRIQDDLGGPHTFPNAPRALDIDLLLYDRLVIDTPLLTIPHPRMAERDFVLRPLADLAPAFEHPQLGTTVFDLLGELTGQP